MKVNNSTRLCFSLMSRDDAELLYELDQDKDVMRYVNGGQITTREYLNDVLLPRMDSYRNEVEGWGLWKVIITETKQFIGWVLIRPMNFFSDEPEFENVEMGWRFKKDSWGNGYATEAAQSIKTAIRDLGRAKKISAIAFEANKPSINIMLKLGLNYIKTDIHKDPLGNHEVVFYELDI
ncbi:MAG: RimJ/RimL family protein N-acetyltransferase [Enterobacterales bacterium]|jgi:RimJ/RimL family protein N-acetyltransferase